MARVAIALIAAFALSSCVLTPGKFVSKLVVNADRSFTFSYTGEVYAADMNDDMFKGLGDDKSSDDGTDSSGASSDDGSDSDVTLVPITQSDDGTPDDAAAKKAATDTKNKAIAAALSKEAGYRKVVYVGDGKFDVDYQISGTLTYNFVFPFNIDAEAIFPFVAIELRGNGTARMKAPGFANEGDMKGMAGANQAASKMDGIFTLDTDAEIVSQNNEDGAITSGTRKIITWKATPTTSAAPMAVLRFK
jgi:hypothetical protein